LEVQADINGNLNPASLTRYDARSFGLQNPQGMTVDQTSGALFIVDAVGPRIVRVQPRSNGSFSGASVSEVSLQSQSFSAVRGIAFDPTSGHLFLINPTGQRLYELTQSGQLTATRDLAPFSLKTPQGMVFAPSGDQTDDPAKMNLYVADSGFAEQQNSGQIVELSLTATVEAAATNFTSSLIRTTNMAAISPPSPDPSGITYLPTSNTLLIVDGEVEETVNGITHFQGANVWELTLLGSKVRTANISTVAPTTTPMTNEPTGVTWNPSNGHYFVTDDNALRVYDLNPGGDSLIGTADDTWTFFSTNGAGNGDPEGIAFDTWNNRLFVADGVNREVYQYTLTGTLINHFDVSVYGVQDPESVEFNPDTGTLFVMSSNSATRVIVETTLSGALLQTIDISATNATAAAGLAYAPASNGSGVKRFYIVDRGIDNNDNPNIVDGKMYEMTAPTSGPTATPTNTSANSPTPTDTATPTATPTSTPTLPSSTNPLFASFANNTGSIGGISFADEDILEFNGTTWSLFFDGSDVGVGGVDLFGFSLLDADTILMSFGGAVTVNGGTLSVTPQDVVKFDATSLGTSTAGTFSMYLDGSTVGLDASGESIDSVSQLSDGRILISTTANPSVPGVSGADEDILAFTPGSGTWSLYFDGSDVGLTTTSEDIDALDVDPNGAIYLSALGDFSVTGISGFDEDVFVCTPSSLGNNTACTFSPTLYFDGSEWGQSANDVDGINLPLGTFPTATPTNTSTNTPTSTNTGTPTSTFTSTNTPTPTATFTATNTPTLGPSPTDTSTPTATSSPTDTPTPTNTSTPGPTFTSTPTFTPSPTAAVSDLIFADGFESGSFSAWSSATTGGGDLSVGSAAALVGSKGMQVLINDTTSIYVTDNTPNAEPHYRARFYFDPNSIQMTDGNAHYIFMGIAPDTTSPFQVDFRFSGGNYQLRLRQKDDSALQTSTAWVPISDAPHFIELEWWAASTVGANDGGVNLWIDGVPSGSLGSLDNDTERIESVKLGAVTALDAGTLGTYYMDAFESRRQTYIGP
jgi:sugar lactone lactonase YvrE